MNIMNSNELLLCTETPNQNHHDDDDEQFQREKLEFCKNHHKDNHFKNDIIIKNHLQSEGDNGTKFITSSSLKQDASSAVSSKVSLPNNTPQNVLDSSTTKATSEIPCQDDDNNSINTSSSSSSFELNDCNSSMPPLLLLSSSLPVATTKEHEVENVVLLINEEDAEKEAMHAGQIKEFCNTHFSTNNISTIGPTTVATTTTTAATATILPASSSIKTPSPASSSFFDTSCNKIRIKKRVHFDQVQIRYYNMVIDMNPACSSGIPIGIGWDFSKDDDEIISIDEFESQKQLILHEQNQFRSFNLNCQNLATDTSSSIRSNGRAMKRCSFQRTQLNTLRLSSYIREDMARNYCGYSRFEIAQVLCCVGEVQRERTETLRKLKFAKVEETIESIKRKVAGGLRKSKQMLNNRFNILNEEKRKI